MRLRFDPIKTVGLPSYDHIKAMKYDPRKIETQTSRGGRIDTNISSGATTRCRPKTSLSPLSDEPHTAKGAGAEIDWKTRSYEDKYVCCLIGQGTMAEVKIKPSCCKMYCVLLRPDQQE